MQSSLEWGYSANTLFIKIIMVIESSSKVDGDYDDAVQKCSGVARACLHELRTRTQKCKQIATDALQYCTKQYFSSALASADAE